LYPEALMNLREQELGLDVAHRRTETAVGSGIEGHEGQIGPRGGDLLIAAQIPCRASSSPPLHPLLEAGTGDQLAPAGD
jgi:hypothetical protein